MKGLYAILDPWAAFGCLKVIFPNGKMDIIWLILVTLYT